jgi:hypothetical protein
MLGANVAFHRLTILGPSVVATTDQNGDYTVDLPIGRYSVSVEGCTSYVVQPTVAPDLDLVVSASAAWANPSLYWLIDPAGKCRQNPPAGL